MNLILVIFSLAFSYLLGFILNKGLSVTNIIKEVGEKGKELLKYDIPFIYTVRLNEIFLVVSITVLFFLCLYYYYSKSDTSITQLFKLLLKTLWIEAIIFIFVMGSWGEKIIENFGENSFSYVNDWILVFQILVVVIFLSMIQENNNIKNKGKEKIKSDLYDSRKNLIPIIDEYLKIVDGFSIIGEWGIGKSKLLENFFYKELDEYGEKYSDKYESIIIDASSYNENRKIVGVIQDELTKILKKYRIFRLNESFVEKVFTSDNNFLKNIKNICFHKNTLIESKESLNKKIEELHERENKKIVLCLDNLERLSDIDRIINLLSIVDDLLGEKIKKIYLYDKKYMIQLFKRNKINFVEYINKYSGIEVSVKDAEIEEIEEVEIILEFIKELKGKVEKKYRPQKLKKQDIEKTIDEYDPDPQDSYTLDELSREVNILENFQKGFQKKLSNPRYLKYLISFVKNKEIKFEKFIKFEYRIIIDIIKDYTFGDEIVKKFFIDESEYEDRIKKEYFQALFEKQYEKKESLEIKKIEDLRLEGIKTQDSRRLLQIIDSLKKDKQRDIINEILNERSMFTIDSIVLLESFYKLYLNDDIKVNFIEKMEFIIDEEVFSKNEKLSFEESKNMIKGTYLLTLFLEVKKFISYLFNEDYIVLDKLFKDKYDGVDNNLKKLGNYNLNIFIKQIDINFKNLDKDDEIFKYIDKIKLEKELRLLVDTKFVKKDNLKENKFDNYLNKGFFEDVIKYKMDYIDVITEEKEKILIDWNIVNVHKVINKDNIVKYEDILKKVNEEIDSKVLKELLYRIFLLKQRLKKM